MLYFLLKTVPLDAIIAFMHIEVSMRICEEGRTGAGSEEGKGHEEDNKKVEN